MAKLNWEKAAQHDKANRGELAVPETPETGHAGAIFFGPLGPPVADQTELAQSCLPVCCMCGREEAKECSVGRSRTPLRLCNACIDRYRESRTFRVLVLNLTDTPWKRAAAKAEEKNAYRKRLVQQEGPKPPKSRKARGGPSRSSAQSNGRNNEK